MPKGFISRDYLPMVAGAGVVAVVLLGFAFFPKSVDWYGWIQAVGLIVGLMVAIAVPAIQRKQAFQAERRQLREREVGYARRLHYFGLEILELLARITASLAHLRATDRHRYQRILEDFLQRLFESHKHDLNDDRIVIIHELRKVAYALSDELESGRSDRVVMIELEKRLQKLVHRTQVNSAQAERG
ncbi:hypothetical protein [Pseudomonas gingeri]